MKYLFIITFLLVYIFFGLELGYTATSAKWTHITYIFQHASVMHLLINSFAFWSLSVALYRHVPEYVITIISVSVAFFISFLCIYPKVVVGASGMIYAMLGIYFFLVCVRKIRYRNKFSLFVAIVSVVTFLAISFVKHNSAGMLHLQCLIFGFYMYALFYKLSTVNYKL